MFYQKTAELFLYFLACALLVFLSRNWQQTNEKQETRRILHMHLVFCYAGFLSFSERFISDPVVLLFACEEDDAL